jgi:hypothetical protein
MLATAEAAFVDLSKTVINSPRLDGLSPAESALYQAKIPFTPDVRRRMDRHLGQHG